MHATVQNNIGAFIISGNQLKKVHELHETLVYNVQSLDTIGKLRDIDGYVRTTLDKQEGIRGDLVRNDKDWQEGISADRLKLSYTASLNSLLKLILDLSFAYFNATSSLVVY